MKASCSGSAIYCFTFIFVVAPFIDPSLGSKSCDRYYKFGMYACPVSRKIYPIYSELEDIVTNDSEILFIMRQAFFPGLVPHVLEAEKDEFVLIRVCVIYNETIPPPVCQGVDINSTLTETRCWNYRWSSSPALNMVDVGQLVAFDPVATSLIYSRFVDHPSNRRFLLMFNVSLEAFSCSPAADNLIGAIVLLSTWSKAYAKAQGVPSKWEQKDQGYIARWYSYYIAEACYGDEKDRQFIRLWFLFIFFSLNILIVITNATHGRKLHSKFCKFIDDRFQLVLKIYVAAAMTVTLINLLYLTFSVLLYIYETTPNMFMAECNATAPYMDCSPPRDSNLYQDETTAFIIKIIVVSIAIIADVVVAVWIVKNDTEKGNRSYSHKIVKIFKGFLLLNVFVFVQLMVGLVSIPVCTFLLITPLQTIPIVCAGILYFGMVVVFFLGLLELYMWCRPKKDEKIKDDKKTSTKIFCCYALLYSLMYLATVILVVALSQLYFTLSSPQSTYAAVFFTLLPPALLSVITYMVKEKILNEDSSKKKSEPHNDSAESQEGEQDGEPLLNKAVNQEGGEQQNNEEDFIQRNT